MYAYEFRHFPILFLLAVTVRVTSKSKTHSVDYYRDLIQNV